MKSVKESVVADTVVPDGWTNRQPERFDARRKVGGGKL
jgi:hypothetical protein